MSIRRWDTLHGYYATQSLLPTYGAFGSDADLGAHERHRRRFFTDKLGLPPLLFNGVRLLEIGPDAGENSLVFAHWGAKCTLAEPNEKAHEVIRGYFDRFGLSDRLSALVSQDLEGFPEPATEADRFDFIDAEGFLFTIKPSRIWIDKLNDLLIDDGFAIVQYVESFGSFLELTWKFVHARYRALTGAEPFDSAQALFATKWASIPHKRSIESWTMDVLENPFVRLEYLLEPYEVAAQMTQAGFVPYSSWPRHDGGLDLHWLKYDPSPQERLEHLRDFVGRSRLSYMFGRKHFLAAPEAMPEPRLLALIADVDRLVDDFDLQVAERVDSGLIELASVLASPAVIAGEDDTHRSLATLDMLRRLLVTLGDGDPKEIERFCNEEPAFVESWGTPSHFTVFRKA